MAREIRRTDSQGLIVGVLSELALEIIDDEINKQKSRKRSKDIREDIENYCRILADAINLPKNLIKQLALKRQMALFHFLHRVFVQVLHERAKKVSLLSLGKQ